MTQLNNVLDVNELSEMLAQGFVRKNMHPDGELAILNYTEKAAYESHWNPTTLRCRGLIYDTVTNEVVARAFDKFFNYGQVGCPEIGLDEPAIVSDKMDGSLGILYKIDGKLAIATRGSFTSDQAIHATEVLRTKYADFKPVPNYTYLFEIIYPENRIVCDYAGMDDLVLLGIVQISSGATSASDNDPLSRWTGPRAEVFPYQTMREALEAPPRAGKEGFVVHLLDSDVRVKIKQEDYIRLHRIVTGLNARSVWQAMLDDTVDELIEQVPDEFHGFVRGVVVDISKEVTNILIKTYRQYLDIYVDPDMTRKEFAMQAVKSPQRAELFLMFDGKDVYTYILSNLKPAHDYSPVKVSNDAD